MGASDDEEELAGLRAARLGTGATQQVSTVREDHIVLPLASARSAACLTAAPAHPVPAALQSYLEEKQRRMTAQTEASRHFFHQPSRGQAAAPGGAWTPAAGEDDEDGPQVVALGEPVAGEGAEDALRGQFPLSFGTKAPRARTSMCQASSACPNLFPLLPGSALHSEGKERF